MGWEGKVKFVEADMILFFGIFGVGPWVVVMMVGPKRLDEDVFRWCWWCSSV